MSIPLKRWPSSPSQHPSMLSPLPGLHCRRGPQHPANELSRPEYLAFQFQFARLDPGQVEDIVE